MKHNGLDPLAEVGDVVRRHLQLYAKPTNNLSADMRVTSFNRTVPKLIFKGLILKHSLRFYKPDAWFCWYQAAEAKFVMCHIFPAIVSSLRLRHAGMLLAASSKRARLAHGVSQTLYNSILDVGKTTYSS